MKKIILLLLLIIPFHSVTAQNEATEESNQEEGVINWKAITPILYQKIAPTGGKLKHSIDRNYQYYKVLNRMIVEFDTMDFVYDDPLYGEHNAAGNFQMYFVFSSDLCNEKIRTIHDLENKEFEFDENERVGAFSNSFPFTVPKCKFGTIENNQIPIEMEYVLTNDVGIISGTYEEHATIKGKIKTKLDIADLIISVNKRTGNLEKFLKFIPDEYYEKDKVKIATGANMKSIEYDLYQIPVKYKSEFKPFKKEDEE